MIEINASYGYTDSFFPSYKKPGLHLESESELYEILAEFSKYSILQLSHLITESMFKGSSSSLTEISS